MQQCQRKRWEIDCFCLSLDLDILRAAVISFAFFSCLLSSLAWSLNSLNSLSAFALLSSLTCTCRFACYHLLRIICILLPSISPSLLCLLHFCLFPFLCTVHCQISVNVIYCPTDIFLTSAPNIKHVALFQQGVKKRWGLVFFLTALNLMIITMFRINAPSSTETVAVGYLIPQTNLSPVTYTNTFPLHIQRSDTKNGENSFCVSQCYTAFSTHHFLQLFGLPHPKP